MKDFFFNNFTVLTLHRGNTSMIIRLINLALGMQRPILTKLNAAFILEILVLLTEHSIWDQINCGVAFLKEMFLMISYMYIQTLYNFLCSLATLCPTYSLSVLWSTLEFMSVSSIVIVHIYFSTYIASVCLSSIYHEHLSIHHPSIIYLFIYHLSVIYQIYI